MEKSAITGADVKRLIPCVATGDNRFSGLDCIEFGPIGAIATDGKVLAITRVPSITEEKTYIEAAKLRSVDRASHMELTGNSVEFVNSKKGTRTSVEPSKDVIYPDVKKMIPSRSDLNLVATFGIDVLKRVVAAMERKKDSYVTIWQHKTSSLTMLANDSGDLAIAMNIVGGSPSYPEAVYAELYGEANAKGDSK